MSVVVIGAGLAGCVAALELKSAGVDVVLLDSERAPMSGASRHNEGKIHLGYVYSKDPTGRTVDLMQEGAMSFAPVLRRHLAHALDAIPISGPFDYVVHPESLMSRFELAERYAGIDARLARHRPWSGPQPYPGDAWALTPRWRDAQEVGEIGLSPSGGQDAYASAERAIEPFALADAVRDAVRREDFDLRCGIKVEAVRVESGKYMLDTNFGSTGPFDSVINASWGSRQLLDRSVGIIDGDRWNYRYKYFLRVRKDGIGKALPNITWTVGPFGDVATYGDDIAYLSWYPAGRIRWSSTGVLPPPKPSPAPRIARSLTQAILSGLAQLLPIVGSINPAVDDIEVWGGLISGNGDTDIDDPLSGLHRRDNIGVTSAGGYHSISTGKLTTAPLVGERAANAVLSELQ